MLIHVIYSIIHDTYRALCQLPLHWFRDKLLYYVHFSEATYYKQYIRKSIQTMYLVRKSAFKWMKPVKIYTIHPYEIVLVSLSWIQINKSTTHKFKPWVIKPYMNRDASAIWKKYYRIYFLTWKPNSKYSSNSSKRVLNMFTFAEAFN